MTLKLADFGLAMEVVKPIFMVCGTPTYVAPEILTHAGQRRPTQVYFNPFTADPVKALHFGILV